jgi:hypothetical protein
MEEWSCVASRLGGRGEIKRGQTCQMIVVKLAETMETCQNPYTACVIHPPIYLSERFVAKTSFGMHAVQFFVI